jgi:hypothetical protein
MSSTQIKRLLAAVMLGLMAALGGCVEEGFEGEEDADVEMEMEGDEMEGMGMGEESEFEEDD